MLFVSCATTKTFDNSNIISISKEAYVIQEKDLADLTTSNTSQQAIHQVLSDRLTTITEKLDELEQVVAAEKAEEYASGYKTGYEKAINDVKEIGRTIDNVQ